MFWGHSVSETFLVKVWHLGYRFDHDANCAASHANMFCCQRQAFPMQKVLKYFFSAKNGNTFVHNTFQKLTSCK